MCSRMRFAEHEGRRRTRRLIGIARQRAWAHAVGRAGGHDRQDRQPERCREQCCRNHSAAYSHASTPNTGGFCSAIGPRNGFSASTGRTNTPRSDHGGDAHGDEPTRGHDVADHGESVSSPTYPATAADARRASLTTPVRDRPSWPAAACGVHGPAAPHTSQDVPPIMRRTPCPSPVWCSPAASARTRPFRR